MYTPVGNTVWLSANTFVGVLVLLYVCIQLVLPRLAATSSATKEKKRIQTKQCPCSVKGFRTLCWSLLKAYFRETHFSLKVELYFQRQPQLELAAWIEAVLAKFAKQHTLVRVRNPSGFALLLECRRWGDPVCLFCSFPLFANRWRAFTLLFLVLLPAALIVEMLTLFFLFVCLFACCFYMTVSRN